MIISCISQKRFRNIWMIPTGPFWMIYYHGHPNCRMEYERTDNQGRQHWRLLNFQGTRYQVFTSILIGIAIQRAALIGASSDPNKNSEMIGLAKSPLISIPKKLFQIRKFCLTVFLGLKIWSYLIYWIFQIKDTGTTRTISIYQKLKRQKQRQQRNQSFFVLFPKG